MTALARAHGVREIPQEVKDLLTGIEASVSASVDREMRDADAATDFVGAGRRSALCRTCVTPPLLGNYLEQAGHAQSWYPCMESSQ